MIRWILAATILLLALPSQADDYTKEAFDAAVKGQMDVQAVIEICRTYAEQATDIDAVRQAQHTWKQLDGDGAHAFFKERFDAEPTSAKWAYLLGRLEEGLERLGMGRKTISLDPNWHYGYRLVAATYQSELFRSAAKGAELERFERELRRDGEAFYKKIVALGEKPSDAQMWLYGYYMHTERFGAARQVLDAAKEAEYGWASEREYGSFYAHAGQLEQAYRTFAAYVDGLIDAKRAEPEEREDYLGHYYVNALRGAKAYREIITYLEERDDYMDDSEKLYETACYWSLLGERARAVQQLTMAVVRGWTKARHTEEDEDLAPLHDHPQWDDLIDTMEKNWEEAAETRRQVVLEQKLVKDAPAWELMNAAGEIVKLEDLRGKVVLLDFWATWCSPCRMAMPVIDRFMRSDIPAGVEVFSINVWESVPAMAKVFMEDQGYAMQLVYGSNETASAYGVRGIPYLCAIDREGKIRYEEKGYSDELAENLKIWVEDLLQ